MSPFLVGGDSKFCSFNRHIFSDFMATVNFFLKQNNKLNSKPTLIYLSFFFEGKRLRISTKEKIHAKNWNQKEQKARRTEDGYSALNQRLEKLTSDYQQAYRLLKSVNKKITAGNLMDKVDELNGVVNKSNKTLMSFIESYIENSSFKVKFGTIKSYKTTLAVLKRFQSHRRSRIDFDSIDLNFHDEFTSYLSRELNYSGNTVGKHIKNTKVFMNEARERGLTNNSEFLKKGFKVFKEDIDSIYLNEEEIKKLYDLDLSDKERLAFVRDLFIVGCYTGLRFSDFTQIKPENIRKGMISLRTQKTNEMVIIPVHPMVEDIMKKYKGKYANSLPPAFTNQVMNNYLKEIGKLAQLNESNLVSKTIGGKKISISYKKYELITTHTARRSFATNLYLQEFPAISIMKITGHRSEKNFMNYIKMSPH
ncbi:MAG: site-specific integrase, partial [Bacteroidota bacterium]